MTRCSLIFSLPFIFYFFAKASEIWLQSKYIKPLVFTVTAFPVLPSDCYSPRQTADMVAIQVCEGSQGGI